MRTYYISSWVSVVSEYRRWKTEITLLAPGGTVFSLPVAHLPPVQRCIWSHSVPLFFQLGWVRAPWLRGPAVHPGARRVSQLGVLHRVPVLPHRTLHVFPPHLLRCEYWQRDGGVKIRGGGSEKAGKGQRKWRPKEEWGVGWVTERDKNNSVLNVSSQGTSVWQVWH